MEQEIVITLLGILTTLFGGLNIFQWITLRSYKRVKAAEADKSEIDALRSIIDGMQAEIGRLQTRLDEAEKRASKAQTYNFLHLIMLSIYLRQYQNTLPPLLM